jgi:hypothetical protein
LYFIKNILQNLKTREYNILIIFFLVAIHADFKAENLVYVEENIDNTLLDRNEGIGKNE